MRSERSKGNGYDDEVVEIIAKARVIESGDVDHFPAAMGLHFGNLARMRHLVTYSLSPFEQKAFANYFSKGIPNVWRRFSGSFFTIAPPMVVAYLVYTWGNEVNKQSKRKNLSDFENDQ